MRGFGYGVMLGALVMGAAWYVSGAMAPSEPHEVGALEADPGVDVAQLEVLDRLERIERRLDGIASRAATSRPRADAPTLAGLAEPGPDAHEPEDATAPRPVITEDVLVKTLERMEEKKYAQLTPAELRSEAKRLMSRERDMRGAKAMLERLLDRDLEPKDRTEALTDLGAVHRSMKDYDASEQALHKAIRIGGEDTQEGVQAGYHLIWTYRQGEKKEQALAMADKVLGWRGLNDQMRPWVRWAGARMALETGDKQRAAADYRALMSDVKDNPAYKQIVQDAKAKLKAME